MMYRVKWYGVSQRYARSKAEADDIFQEGLIRIFKDLHQYDKAKASFGTWSYRVIAHAALRFLKKNCWMQKWGDLNEAEEQMDTSESIYDKLAAKELTELLQQLPVGYRLVFNMYVLEGYSHKEIAKHMGIADGTSRSQLAKAKKMLQRKLEYHLSEYS